MDVNDKIIYSVVASKDAGLCWFDTIVDDNGKLYVCDHLNGGMLIKWDGEDLSNIIYRDDTEIVLW